MKALPTFASLRARYRWSVASRVLAAVVGGYALTSLLNIALPLLLEKAGANLPQVLLGTTLASFLIYATIIMAMFSVRSATRAWVWLAGTALPLVLIVALLLPSAAP